VTILCTAAALVHTSAACADAPFEWRHHGADAGNTKYAPLEQIDSSNVEQVRMVWRWRSDEADLFENESPNMGLGPNKSTPIQVGGVLYTVTSLSIAVALDAATGRQLWTFDPESWRAEESWGWHRGPAYWSDGDGEQRILFGTVDAYLYSVDARTGVPDPAFGDGGRIDLTEGLGGPVDREAFKAMSPPIVFGDLVAVGGFTRDSPHKKSMAFTPRGDMRAFDVRTGEPAWTFHTVPMEDEFGTDTWENESWKSGARNNVWSMMSFDEELGYLYLPVGSPNNDHYGATRPGDNLFGSSLVCLDASTGERVWHFQTNRHPLWNYDLAAAPILLDIVVDGKPIKAVVQVTKQAFAFVLDRVTGEPVWPIVDQPATPSTAPGEVAAATQPRPTRPAPFDRQGITEDDLIDFTPELHQEALEIIARYDHGPLFSPPTQRGVINMPGGLGGADWVGAAAHPGKGWLYVPSHTLPTVIRLHKLDDADEAQPPFWGPGEDRLDGPRGLPLTKPPYGRLTAIDLNTGEHVWMTPTGSGPVNHPALKNLNLPPLGYGTRWFVLATSSLLFAVCEHPYNFAEVDPEFYVDPEAYLFAFDLDSGRQLAQVELPGNAYGNPMTYMVEGRQYIAVPIGAQGRAAGLVGMAIPLEDEKLPLSRSGRDDADHPAYYEAVAAIDAGNVAELDRLLSAHDELIRARGYLDELYDETPFRGATLLHHVAGNPVRAALQANVVEVAQALIAAGADPEAVTIDSTSVLNLVVDAQQPRWLGVDGELVSLLLDAGASADSRGGYLLWNATMQGQVRTAQVLVDAGARFDVRIAAGLNRVDLLERFFDEDSTLIPASRPVYHPRSERPDTTIVLSAQETLDHALSFAALRAGREAAQFLLTHGAGIDAQTPGFYRDRDRGSTALHKAASEGQAAVVTFLLESGADPNAKDMKWDSTPAVWARYSNQPEIAEVLEQAEKTAAVAGNRP